MMNTIKINDGNLILGERVEGVDEFLQRVANSLLIFSDETFYDQKLGINLNVMDNQKNSVYKMEHIKNKLLNWYGSELIDLQYVIHSEIERKIVATFYFNHKEYGNVSREVTA